MASVEEHHARVFLWRVLEELPIGYSLIGGRVSENRVDFVIVTAEGKQTRVRARTWDEAARRLATQLSIEAVRKEGERK